MSGRSPLLANIVPAGWIHRILLLDRQAQPTNSDTMGDLTFDILGTTIGVLMLKAAERDIV